MKKIVKIMALFLIAAMLLCASACGGPDIEGEWKAELDFTDYINDLMSNEIPDYDSEVPFSIFIILELNKDGSCSLSIDEKKTANSFEAFKSELLDAAVEMMYKMGEDSGMSREQFDEAMMTAYGVDAETYMRESMEQLNSDDILNKLNINEDGFYKLDGDELLISDDEDDFSDAETWKIEVKGDSLTVLSISDNSSDFEEWDQYDLFPLHFER